MFAYMTGIIASFGLYLFISFICVYEFGLQNGYEMAIGLKVINELSPTD